MCSEEKIRSVTLKAWTKVEHTGKIVHNSCEQELWHMAVKNEK